MKNGLSYLKKYRLLCALAVLAVTLCLFLSSCGGGGSASVVHDGTVGAYPKTVSSLFGGEPKKVQSDSLFSAVNGGDLAVCYDVQAEGAIKNGIVKYWYPRGLATVVIAVDRDQTEATVGGWCDLKSADVKVGFAYDMHASGNAFPSMVAAAVAYGLEGEGYSTDCAFELFKEISEQGRLSHNDAEAPVIVCFDHYAAALARSGKNLQIVVPEEGTLSYELGVLSSAPLTFTEEAGAALKASGFRLSDGDAPDFYPDDYGNAARVADMGKFFTETKNTQASFQREVSDIRHFTSSEHREHVFAALLFLIVAVLWLASVLKRVMWRKIRGLSIGLSVFVIGWTLLRLIKWQLPSLSLMNRICWYSFQLFQIPIPILLLWLGLVIDKPQATSDKAPKLIKALFAVYLCIMLAIYTNDFHQLVWSFDFSGDWNNVYSYGPVFYFLTVFNYGVLISALVLMFIKARKAPNVLLRTLPMLCGGLMALYTVSYVMGIPWAKNGDMTIITCAISLLFFESAVRTRLIPVNSKYSTVFSKSPLDMQLVDTSGRVVLKSDFATDLGSQLWQKLCESENNTVNLDENTLLCANDINGGKVVWSEDISAINELNRETEYSISKIQNANRILQKEGETSRQKIKSKIKTTLFDAMEKEIRENTLRLSLLIKGVQEETDIEKIRAQTAEITLLLCHIKRRCNLFFIAYEDEMMLAEELSVYLDELSEIGGYSGIKAMVSFALKGAVDVRRATLLYDYYFETLYRAAKFGIPVLFGCVEKEGERLVFRLTFSDDASSFSFDESFEKAVSEAGGVLEQKKLEESIGLSLSFDGNGGVL